MEPILMRSPTSDDNSYQQAVTPGSMERAPLTLTLTLTLIFSSR
jgi:hypothetical protein